MSSQRKIAANRSNGRKSRGPLTAAGKSCSSRNALRHGLAVITRHSVFPEIDRMANAICDGDTNPLLFEQALVIAENEIVLRCVCAERIAVIERLRDIAAQPLTRRDNSLARAKARFRLVKIKYKRLVQAKAQKVAINNRQAINNGQQREATRQQESAAAQPAGMQKPIRTRDEFDAMRHAVPDLDRLVRYERRAWSRRKRAIRNFIEIKSRIDG
jgi:hypothetical protein